VEPLDQADELRARLTRINAVLRGIRNVNQLIVHERDPVQLCREICDNLAGPLGYSRAWIVLFGPGDEVQTIAHSGFGDVGATLDTVLGNHPSPFCIRTVLAGREPLVLTHPEGECEGCPVGSRCSDRTVLIAALEHAGKRYGVLNVSTLAAQPLNEEERVLFQELTRDLSFAFYRLEVEQARDRAEAELAGYMSDLDHALQQGCAAAYRRNFDRDEYDFFGVAIERISGYSVAELTPALWDEITVRVDAFGELEGLPADEAFRRMRVGEIDHWLADLQLRTRDGRLRWVADMSTALRDASGHCYGCLGIVQNITSRRGTETALRESEQRYRRLFDSMLSGMAFHEIICDDSGHPIDYRFLQVNPAFETHTGLTAETVIGKTVLEVMPDTERHWIETYGAVALTGKPASFESYSTELSRHFEVSAFSPEPRRFVTVFRDITENHRAMEDKKRLQAQLQQQQKLESIGTLASGVAHEINNPINGVMNYAQLIIDRSPGNKGVQTFAREIVVETERVADIVRALLTFARQEKERHSFARLQDVVEATLSLVRTILRHDQIALTVELPDTLPRVRCRSQQIQQVLMNFITNARDALNERYPESNSDKTLRIAGTVLEEDGKHWVRLTVEDHGTGIPEDAVPRLLDPFYTTKSPGVGTGLGLSVSHGIAREHNGRLQLETVFGERTCFHLDLPVTAAGVDADEGG
jgi:PAS domain S-box-containing protein